MYKLGKQENIMAKVIKYSDNYLKRCQNTSIEERLDFLNNYQLSKSNQEFPSKTINFEVPECLLNAFKFKSQLSGVDYHTQINKLMKQWLDINS